MMEETLFDILGNPVAYISYKDGTIYMWDGRPVVYLEPDKTLYGFNGKHLGWYEDGKVRNLKGEIVGFNRMAADVYLGFEPFKSYKKFLPFRRFKEFSHFKPFYGYGKAKESLAQFLLEGQV